MYTDPCISQDAGKQVFGTCPSAFISDTHKDYCLSHSIFNYLLFLALQESIYGKVKKTYYVSAGFACRRVVGLGDSSTDAFLDVENEKYSRRLYLIDYIVYGLHLRIELQYSGKCAEDLFPSILA